MQDLVPVSKNLAKPVCLKLLITLPSVTHKVTDCKLIAGTGRGGEVLIAGNLRGAGGVFGHPVPLSCSQAFPNPGVAGPALTARIEGARLYRAASASQKDGPAAPLPILSKAARCAIRRRCEGASVERFPSPCSLASRARGPSPTASRARSRPTSPRPSLTEGLCLM